MEHPILDPLNRAIRSSIDPKITHDLRELSERIQHMERIGQLVIRAPREFTPNVAAAQDAAQNQQQPATAGSASLDAAHRLLGEAAVKLGVATERADELAARVTELQRDIGDRYDWLHAMKFQLLDVAASDDVLPEPLVIGTTSRNEDGTETVTLIHPQVVADMHELPDHAKVDGEYKPVSDLEASVVIAREAIARDEAVAPMAVALALAADPGSSAPAVDCSTSDTSSASDSGSCDAGGGGE